VQRATREALAVARGKTDTHQHLKDRLLAILSLTIVMSLIFSVIVFLAERHAHGTQIHTFPDALLFTTSQLFTASSVDAPITRGVQVLELLFDLYAIFVVAALAGSFGAFFHHRSVERKAAAEKHPAHSPASAAKK